MLTRALAACAFSLATAALGPAAWAQAYPSKPIKLVVPFAPGGATDVVARALGERLQARTGQPVVIDNKPGASSMIGADAVAKAPADGYTLLVSGSSTYTVVPALKPRLPYDPQNDLALLGIVAKVPLVLVVASSKPVKTFGELLALAKQKEAALSYATFGPGSAPHLAGEMLSHEAGIKLMPVPYRGSAPATLAVMGGEIDVGIDTLAAALPHIKAGKLRALALLDTHRNEALPEVATIAELKLPGATFEGWYGVAVPARTPAAIQQQLAKELAAILAEPDVKEKLRNAALEPVWQDGAAFKAKVQAEVAKYAAVGKRSNIVLD